MEKKVIRLQPEVPLEEIGVAEKVLEGNPMQSDNMVYSSEDGKVMSGVWSCEPGKFAPGEYEVEEVCFVLDGKLGIINNEDGSEQIFKKGDSFVVPKGADTTWIVYKKLKKFYMISS
jgi:uncharacterized cupin superfamily protein